MNIPFVDLHAQYLSIKDQIDEAIGKIIADTAFIGGKYVKEFETNFAKYYGVKHCVGVANGTDAIYIALKMMGIGDGDEVITVANSWISTSETISQTGAKPVFIDIEPSFYTIDVTKIEEKINENTKAIIPVHLYGHPADMEPIVDLCRRYDLKLIEDCAQAHFAEYKGKHVGLFGDLATFSFYPGKNLGAYGDAGCIITNDDELAEKCRMYANHGSLIKHQHKMEGINSRLDGIQAAILNAKLPHIFKWTEARRNVAEKYCALLKETDCVSLPKEAENAKHVYHLFVIRTDNRDSLKTHLNNSGIGTAIHYPTPLPLLESYNYLKYSNKQVPVAFKYSQQILSIPIFPELSDDQIDHIAENITLYAKNNRVKK